MTERKAGLLSVLLAVLVVGGLVGLIAVLAKVECRRTTQSVGVVNKAWQEFGFPNSKYYVAVKGDGEIYSVTKWVFGEVQDGQTYLLDFGVCRGVVLGDETPVIYSADAP